MANILGWVINLFEEGGNEAVVVGMVYDSLGLYYCHTRFLIFLTFIHPFHLSFPLTHNGYVLFYFILGKCLVIPCCYGVRHKF